MEKYKKIMEMETILDHHNQLLQNLNQVLDEFEESRKEYQRLRQYYYSEEFLQDVERADHGEIPSSVKCGVLSEDAVFDLIGDNFQTAIRMLETATKIIKEH